MTGSAPLFSVVVPTYERPDALATCLDAWERQEPDDLPFELIVVDDGSAEPTVDVLSRWRSHRYPLVRLRQTNAGPARARNRGFAEAKGRYVFFAGDDIEPSPDLLARHLAGHASHPGDTVAIVGRIRWATGARPTRTMLHVDGPGAQQFGFHWMEHDREYDFRHFYTSNVSVSRELLALEPGPFCTAFPAAAWEDTELAYRLSRQGLRIVYRADAVAWHHHTYRAASFYRRQVACGRMATVLVERFPQLAEWARLQDLSEAGVRLARRGGARIRQLDEVAADLDAWTRRALAVASFHDPVAQAVDPPLDGFLVRLFDHAYLEGVAGSRLDRNRGRRLLAELFLGRLLPAIIDLGERLDAAGRAAGTAADWYAFRSLADRGLRLPRSP